MAAKKTDIKKEKQQEKIKFTHAEKQFDETAYRIIIGTMIFAILYYMFWEPKTLGSDIRYHIFIFWVPVLSGTIILGIYRRGFLINQLMTNRGFEAWAYMIPLYLAQGLLASYLIFGQIAMVSWNLINSYEAQQNPKTMIRCDVTEFSGGRRSNNIWFTFLNQKEYVKTNRSVIERNLKEDPDNYKIEVEVQKGIWGYYVLNNWELYLK